MKRKGSTYNKRNKTSDNPIFTWVPYYHNAVILGGSISESILDYRLLRVRNVIARRGISIDQVSDKIAILQELQPSVLFMEFGKDDIAYYSGDEHLFVTEYRRQILHIQHILPQIKVCINSIIPMRFDIMALLGGTQVYQRFNEALKEMCKEHGYTYIDNTELLNWEDDIYEYDGIHPKYPYYPKWLTHMAKKAHLKAEK